MHRFCNSRHVRNLVVMVLRLNELAESIVSLHMRLLRPGTTFVPFYSVYSTPRVSLTMPQNPHSCCPEDSCRKKFISDSWRHKYIKLRHPEHHQVACQKNQTIHSAP